MHEDSCSGEKMIIEGSAALALAGFERVARDLAGKTSVIVLYSPNADHDTPERFICFLNPCK